MAPSEIQRRHLRGRRARRGEEGFTLLELMVIVVIVMALAAALAPSAVRAFATYRAQAASLEVLHMARIARREAIESGRAIVVRGVDGATGLHIEVRRGDTNLCRTGSWATLFASTCESASDLDRAVGGCIGYVDPDQFSVGVHTVDFQRLDNFDICYQPNGDAMVTPGGGNVFARPPAGTSAVTYLVRRLESGTDADPVRTIIMPFDSSPRSVR